MSKIELPICEHRHPTDAEDKFLCSHPKVHSPNNVVTVNRCVSCIAYKIKAEPRDMSGPSMGEQAANYINSTLKHFTGGHLLEQYKIDQRLDICKGCEHYKDERCGLCGCKCNNKASQFMNKLARSAEKCPIDKWLPEPT
jgi:hypothetical protein